MNLTVLCDFYFEAGTDITVTESLILIYKSEESYSNVKVCHFW